MQNDFGYSVSFRVRHRTMAASALADSLAIVPKWSWQVGEQRQTPKGTLLVGTYTDSYCTFDVASGDDGKFAKCLCETVERLVAHREFFRVLRATGGSVAFYVSWYPNGDTGETLDAKLLSEIRDPGIDLMLNVYDDREAAVCESN